MLVVRLAVAACVLLVLTACGAAGPASPAGRTNGIEQSVGTPSPTAAAERSDYVAKNAVRKKLADHITMTVSVPTSFTPTDTAYPKAARAVAFELVIDNQSDTVYRPAQLSFVATVDGAATDQIIDSTQGYTGVVGAIDEVLPRQNLRFAIAFGVPNRPCAVRVAVRPESSSVSAIPIYDGTA